MLATQRRQNILNYVWKYGEINTNQAVELFGFSAPTVRRDFARLVQSHPAISRTHGGIKMEKQNSDKEFEFDIKLRINSNIKQQIAARAFEQIKPNDCIFLDSGSTCFELAKYLKNMPLTVITTDLKIAEYLSTIRDIELYIVGGRVRTGFFSLGDSMASEALKQFTASKGFMSCDAISLAAGVTNTSMFEVAVKRRIIEQSAEVFMMVDSSKLETTAPYAVSSLSVIRNLVTDQEADPTLLADYAKCGMQIFQ